MSKINKELDSIVKKNNDTISAEMIVQNAQIKDTVLYNDFKKRGLFDADKTMRYAQLTYAGLLLRTYKVWITISDKKPIEVPVKVRGLVSLSTDRIIGGGVYRPIVSVMEDNNKRETYLNDAKKELAAFRCRYSTLTELSLVFDAIDKISN